MNQTLVEWSINDFVLVKLTPAAEAVWARHWTPTRRLLEGKSGVPDAVRHTDSEGRTRFQLWQLMEIFGQEMFMGNPRQMFEQNKIWTEHEL